MKMKIQFVVILALTVCGCSTRSAWLPLNEESPLCGGEKIAIPKARTCTPPFFVPAAEWTEEGWEIDGKIIQKYDVAKRIDDHLESMGFFSTQKSIGAWSEGVQQRVASNRFFIVSLEPTIVIMTPYDFGSTDNKSIRDLASVLNDRHLLSRCLVNGYHYGRSVPVAQTYKWFSPDMKTKIADVQESDSTFRIESAKIVLTFGSTRTNEFYLVTREK